MTESTTMSAPDLHVVPPLGWWDETDLGPVLGLPVMTHGCLARRATRRHPLVAVGGVVLDLTPVVAGSHPGGPHVLVANAGLDATDDVELVSLHGQPAVRSRLVRHACARLAAAPADPTWHAWQRVLDLAVLVRNALWLQVQVPRPGGDLLVYVGQSYAHLLRDHAVQLTRDLSLLGLEEPVDLPAPQLDGLLAAIARDRSDAEATDLANALLADAVDVLAAVVDAASLTMEWLEQVGGVGEVGALDGVGAADAADGTRSDVRRARQVRRLLSDWVAGHAARLVVLDRGRS